MKTINVYLIATEGIKPRERISMASLAAFARASEAVGWTVRVNKIMTSKNIDEANGRIDYKPTGDEIIDKNMQQLYTEEVSNILAHEKALRMIATNTSQDTVHIIMEDDAIFIEEKKGFIEPIMTKMLEWRDMCRIVLLGMEAKAQPADNETDELLRPFSIANKFIINKEAYAITPKCATALLDKMTPIRLPYRIWLSWVAGEYIYMPRAAITIDGSKTGIVPSSIHSNNIPIYNREFMEMYRMLQTKNIDIEKATEMITATKALESSDLYHMYGVLLHNVGRHADALEAFETAYEKHIQQGGMVSARSDMLNNNIAAYRFMQKDVSIAQSEPSPITKWEVM